MSREYDSYIVRESDRQNSSSPTSPETAPIMAKLAYDQMPVTRKGLHDRKENCRSRAHVVTRIQNGLVISPEFTATDRPCWITCASVWGGILDYVAGHVFQRLHHSVHPGRGLHRLAHI